MLTSVQMPQNELKTLIGVWTATGALRKHDFRDLYIKLMDYTYPYLPRAEHSLYPELAEWILWHSKMWCRQKGGVYNMFPNCYIQEALDRTSGIQVIYTEEEQYDLFTLLISRDYEKKGG